MLLKINYYRFASLLIAIALFSCSKEKVNEEEETPLEHTEGTVKVSKWKGNKKAAITLQFDDSTPGQAKLGIPAFVKHGLVGTWYVNPGSENYKKYIDYWENIGVKGGQELANHTMSHKGGNSAKDIEYEIGEASRIIWKTRGEEEFASLIAFNRGGGTSWDKTILQQVINKYYNIDRVYDKIPHKGISIHPNKDWNEMFKIVPETVKDSAWGRINFHGISAEQGKKDEGWGAVWIKDLEIFLDKLVSMEKEIWVGGYIQVYKYIQERKVAKASIKQYNENKYKVFLTAPDLSAKYFNEPLSLIVCVSKDWTKCSVTHENKTQDYDVKQGFIFIDAKPNRGEIVIVKK